MKEDTKSKLIESFFEDQLPILLNAIQLENKFQRKDNLKYHITLIDHEDLASRNTTIQFIFDSETNQYNNLHFGIRLIDKNAHLDKMKLYLILRNKFYKRFMNISPEIKFDSPMIAFKGSLHWDENYEIQSKKIEKGMNCKTLEDIENCHDSMIQGFYLVLIELLEMVQFK